MDWLPVETVEQVRLLIEAGWSAVFILVSLMLWRAYQARTAEYIEALREIAGMRNALPHRPPEKATESV